MAETHHLAAAPKTVHWGLFGADIAPVMEVRSGDTVVIDTVSGGPDVLPGDGYHVPPELLAIHAETPRHVPGHILTGPVRVAGAKAGQVLQVDILDVRLRQDWGYNFIRPLAGALAGEFHEMTKMTIRLDDARGEGELPWGTRLPLRPFFGVMGVAPPANWGQSAQSSRAPMAAISITRKWSPAPHCFCRSSSTARISRPATATAARAMARSV